ncbi:DNA-binding Lrp family transcriptional regulator [Roseivirga ehrenbergii]|uniref:AsnC family transcriptional regulator n=1 Tax=Roseivirga ehrenbergii (strain DSM 102268 / JCM 13514 / KCTC 12282 / NCIMB 14502 / KMM 6017) TaxID=279360 RepID=A0A150XK62_ROSEK|nr:Lrp/AsnC family transcriptional regulator [Roseivirga ehrenbergii]KYG79119.1 AsnC family transcriptional regulator [Roseivirga ehrenbergii]TCK99084.1 DNA-binding Lrp family transcriptional regulator [Roseivirga ehrenbergii]
MVDKIDKQILRLLQLDAKKTTKEIAADLGLTTTPVHERIKKLEREGYIQQYSIRIDRKKVGLMMMAFCSVSLKNHERAFIEKFEQDIQLLDEVIDCYHIGGMFDYLLKVLVPDMDAYQRFISKKLADLDNIGNVQSSFVMSEIKHSAQIPDQFL